jgi:hypothetical protein
MPAAVGVLTSSFSDNTLAVVSILVTRDPQNTQRVYLKKLERASKKYKKKLVRASRVPLEGNVERQMPSFRRSKKVQKSEKKACQGLRNLISLLKPNQTNGETNDTKRTKNV